MTDQPPATADTARLAERLDAVLPQTQCTKCGYDGCRPYAQALAMGQAPINRCPPGGDAGIAQLAAILGVTPLPLDTTRGTYGPRQIAWIDEQHCIGCTLCIQACPVDAIVGANLRMHTVIDDLCTGCDLCVPPCPVDCIIMQPMLPERWWQDHDAQEARQRYHARQARQERLTQRAHSRLPGDEPGSRAQTSASVRPSARPVATAVGPVENPEAHSPTDPAPFERSPEAAKQAAIGAALARARARRQRRS